MYLVKAFVSVTLVVYSFVDVGVLKDNSDQQAQSPKKKKIISILDSIFMTTNACSLKFNMKKTNHITLFGKHKHAKQRNSKLRLQS